MQKVEPQPTYVFTSDIAQTSIFFFFNDTATTEIYTLSLHDALPISGVASQGATAGFAGISAGTRPPGADRRQPGVPYARDGDSDDCHSGYEPYRGARAAAARHGAVPRRLGDVLRAAGRPGGSAARRYRLHQRRIRLSQGRGREIGRAS